MFEWLVPPMLRVATRMVRAPVPMQDLNLVASCMRLLDALLLPEFRDSPQLIADMNDNVQMVRHLSDVVIVTFADVHKTFHAASSALSMRLSIAIDVWHEDVPELPFAMLLWLQLTPTCCTSPSCTSLHSPP